MRVWLWSAGVLWSGLAVAGEPVPPPESNVNSRYTVEAIELAREHDARISSGLRREMRRLVGSRLDPSAVEDLAREIRRELRARSVSHRVSRGGAPDRVRVAFLVSERPARFEISVPKFLYQSRQGWSAGVEATSRVGDNGFTFGLISDGDELLERFAGIQARYERRRLGSERVGLRVLIQSFHQQWNGATREAAGEGGTAAANGDALYRARQNFEPLATFDLAHPLTLSAGVSFSRLEQPLLAAGTGAANAVVTNLRYHRRFEGSGSQQQELEAGYGLRAATRALSSDYVYSRHRWHFRYTLNRGRHSLIEEVFGGRISGRAPLFERFAAGNGSVARGWDKFRVAPLGGDRLMASSLEYRYRWLQVFYDAASVWTAARVVPQKAVARHSVGVGLRQKSFCLAVAFPLKDGRSDPVFLLGMNY